MIQFTVTGTPISQGSKTAWVPTGRNADINAAIYALQRAEGSVSVIREARATAKRLVDVGNWPIYVKSKTSGNGRWLANLREDRDKKLKPWRKAVAKAAREAYDGEPMTRGLRCDYVYFFRRPKNHYGTGRNADKLKAKAPVEMEQLPDRDKLDRAINDALTGIIFDDDKRNATGFSSKLWRASRDEAEGVEITIWD